LDEAAAQAFSRNPLRAASFCLAIAQNFPMYASYIVIFRAACDKTDRTLMVQD